ncbi:MAG: hypothetical protein IJY27_04095 [Clostridia bacterium]|nr:hypothetical protein [Clostridia bacterium]
MDKIPAGEIKDRSPFLKWLDNYWYHYKVPTIIVLFSLFVVIVCTFQMCTTSEKYDVTVLYTGPYLMTSSERSGVINVLNTAMSEDLDQDGHKSVELITYQVMSEQQLRDMAAETDENGKPLYEVNRTYYTKEYENYSNMMMTGEFAVCMLDPWLYEGLANADRLKKLTDVFGEIPEGAVGEYGVRLGDTALYQYYDALKILPEDTVVCLLLPYVFGANSKEETYAKSIQMFRDMVEFKMPE